MKSPRQDEFKRGIVISLGVHIAVFLVLTIKTVFFSGEPINYQSAIRVDLVALPDKISPEQAPPEAKPETKTPEAKAPPKPEPVKAKPEPKKEPKEVPDPNAPTLKKKEKDALNKLKAMEALEKLKQENQKNTAAASKKVEGEHKFKGNIISPGTELTGLNRLQHEEYISMLDRHIKQNWTLPEWLANKNLKAQVNVRIDDKGHIISKTLVKSSGNPAYDDIVKLTIDKSDPFPVPPDKFTAIVSVQGILIGFPE
jgi:colicin import membrane protein